MINFGLTQFGRYVATRIH